MAKVPGKCFLNKHQLIVWLTQRGSISNITYYVFLSSGLYYKPITIVNDVSSIINRLETSLIDDARVGIYDHHMFIVQATGANNGKTQTFNLGMNR